MTESLEEMQDKLILWKTNMEGKGLRINMGKTKVLVPGPDSMCFRSLTKIPVPCISRASAQTPFLWWLFLVGSQEMQRYLWHSRV